jgi:hypothetical protein
MQDLRLAIRALRATPIVTAVAILSLALGIGANRDLFARQQPAAAHAANCRPTASGSDLIGHGDQPGKYAGMDL